MTLRIDVLCSDGSPLGVHVDDIYGQNGRVGVGGAELALLTMCEAWHKRGDHVVLYNNPKRVGSPFEQRPVGSFNPAERRDVLIVFRSPNEMIRYAKCPKVWWSCDQRTIGDFRQFAGFVQKIVTISPHHSAYFETEYGIKNTVSIDIPVRIWDYDVQVEKEKNLCLFCSIPDRGVMQLNAAWPRIVAQVPDAKLIITSDWRLWSESASIDYLRPYQLSYARHQGVQYRGAVSRADLVRLQLQAEFHLYPCIYPELFCISAAETQVAGALPITSTIGALETTNMGIKIEGSPMDPRWLDRFVAIAVERMKDPQGSGTLRSANMAAARERFDIQRILKAWDENVFSI